MLNNHTFQCRACGEMWRGQLESVYLFGTYDACTRCGSTVGSYHICCQDAQGKFDEEIQKPKKETP